MIGIATHYQAPAARETLCGRGWVRLKTDDKKRVDCLVCRRILRKQQRSNP